MKTRKIINLLLTLGLIVTGSIVASSKEIKTNAASDEIKTLSISSGYKTCMFAPVSPIRDKVGATIEFDLYSSNFYQLDYIKDYDISLCSGTSGTIASVNFVFGKYRGYPYDMNPACPVWHVVTQEYAERNFGGFQVLCNGKIKEWSDQGNWKIITNYIGDPKKFMQDGYSYKVSLTYTPFVYNGETFGNGNAWFVCQRKPLFTDDSQYELAFAFAKQMANNTNFTNLDMAGIEFEGLCAYGNLSMPASNDGKGHSIEAEIDNLKIYDGMQIAPGVINYCEDFDTEVTYEASTLETVNAVNTIYNGNKHLNFGHGIYLCSTNYGRAFNRKANDPELLCGIKYNTKQTYNVIFKDATTKETLMERKVYKGLDFSDTRIEKDGKVYKFDYSSIDFSNVAPDTEILGSTVDYFKIKFNSNIQDVSAKNIRVGLSSLYTVEDDIFIRPGYDLVGYSTNMYATYPDYFIGDIIDLKCHDLELYAIWKKTEYKTIFKNGGYTMSSVVVYQDTTPYYNGTTPTSSKGVFVGWDNEVEANSNKTIKAIFANIDANADNRVLDINGSLKFKKAGYNVPNNVNLIFDLYKLETGSVVKFLDVDITNYLETNYTNKIVFHQNGTITIYKSLIGANMFEKVADVNTSKSYNDEYDLFFSGKVQIDDFVTNFDGRNEYKLGFDSEETINSGIYSNFYNVEGNASTVLLEKNIVVTFKDASTNRIVFKEYVVDGGNGYIPSIEGVSSIPEWNKNVNDLKNLHNNVEVVANIEFKKVYITYCYTDCFNVYGVDKQNQDKQYNYGSEISLPTMEYEDFVVIGWTDNPDGGFAKYKDKLVVKEDMTLYSVWGKNKTCMVTFVDDNDNVLATQKVNYNGTARYDGIIPTKEGYAFKGYDKSLYCITSDVTIKLVYEKLTNNIKVSILGGNESGLYSEGDIINLTYQDIKSYELDGFELVSGDGSLVKNGNGYTYTVGKQDTIIKATSSGQLKKNSKKGCKSATFPSMLGLLTIVGTIIINKKKKEL